MTSESVKSCFTTGSRNAWYLSPWNESIVLQTINIELILNQAASPLNFRQYHKGILFPLDFCQWGYHWMTLFLVSLFFMLVVNLGAVLAANGGCWEKLEVDMRVPPPPHWQRLQLILELLTNILGERALRYTYVFSPSVFRHLGWRKVSCPFANWTLTVFGSEKGEVGAMSASGSLSGKETRTW